MRGEKRRRQILEAAVVVFAREGYEKASIAKVCTEAQIARGTLYQYFRDKNALFREVIEAHLKRISAHMVPFTIGEGEVLDRDRIAELLTARIRLILELVQGDREIYTILVTEALAKNAAVEDLYREIDRQLLNLITEELELAAEHDILTVDKPELVACMILGAITKIAFNHIITVEQPRDLGTLATDVASNVLKMLLK